MRQVLWSYHTTPYSSPSETPYRLTFVADTVILVEIGEPSLRTIFFEPTTNIENLRAQLDLLQDEREIAHIKEQATKSRATKRYNITIVRRPFKRNGLVLRRSLREKKTNKLTPN